MMRRSRTRRRGKRVEFGWCPNDGEETRSRVQREMQTRVELDRGERGREEAVSDRTVVGIGELLDNTEPPELHSAVFKGEPRA